MTTHINSGTPPEAHALEAMRAQNFFQLWSSVFNKYKLVALLILYLSLLSVVPNRTCSFFLSWTKPKKYLSFYFSIVIPLLDWKAKIEHSRELGTTGHRKFHYELSLGTAALTLN